MELTTKAEPIFGKFKGFRQLLCQLILDVRWIIKLLAPPDKKPKYIFHNICQG